MTFIPQMWFWQAEDGRVYSGLSQAIVASDDPNYVAWTNGGNVPTPWPRDNSGAQTNEALQAVLGDYNMYVDVVAYVANTRWQKEVGGIVAGGVSVATDDRSKMMLMGARLAAQADPAFTTVWVGQDGNSYPLSAAAIIAISDAVQVHVNKCFTAFSAVKAAVAAGTVTSRAAADQAFAAAYAS